MSGIHSTAEGLGPGDVLPEYRVAARNLARDPANRIHDDGVWAREPI